MILYHFYLVFYFIINICDMLRMKANPSDFFVMISLTSYERERERE